MAEIEQHDLFADIKDARILVVGDLPDVVDIFTEEDYTAVTHAQKASDITAQFLREWKVPGRLSLAVLSIDLPGGDPFELCRILNQQEGIPVVMVGSDGVNEWKSSNTRISNFRRRTSYGVGNKW